MSSTPADRRKGSRKPAPASKKKPLSTPKPINPPDLQSSKDLLTLFHRTFSDLFANPNLRDLLQTVKHHLYNRDYAQAFGTPAHLQAYVIRWSPSRALCYRAVFLDLCPELREVFDVASSPPGTTTGVVCIGGGAGAELVGAVGAVKTLLLCNDDSVAAAPTLHLTAVDIADWDPSFTALLEGMRNHYLPNPKVFSADFRKADILAPESAGLIPKTTRLVTLLFTTNELYTQSRTATTRFLLSLAGLVETGCLLLVLESAGSYSTVKVGEKTFSMSLLLEHTLLGTDGKGGDWEKVMGDDSRWYRLPQGLKYPLSLENMRYFVRMFKRI